MAVEPRLWRKLNSAIRSLQPAQELKVEASDIPDAVQCQCDHQECPIGCPKECACQQNWKDLIPGGLADSMTPADFDPEQLKKGVAVELEHTSNKRIALEVAMDHLAEDPAYYDKLAKMEATGANDLSSAAEAEDLLGQAYSKILGVKGYFDAWEEIYPEAQKVYNQALKAITKTGEAKAEAHQLRMMVRGFANKRG